MNILITGGAGYIGSHVVKQLLETTKHNIIILDNLSTGSTKTLDTLRSIRNFKFVELDLNEFDKVDNVIKENKINTIMHFSASIVVPESIVDPLKYYMNNTVNTTNLIKCAVDSQVGKFIFSSTAATYGEPVNLPKSGIDETHQTKPINPYGMSKLMSEEVLHDTGKAYDKFKYIIFRYFNVAGADMYFKDTLNSDQKQLSPRMGQSFPNATHLIKISSECAAGVRDRMAIFGDDFPTHDGTGVRDYIHVDDLADAHIKALDYLNNNDSDIFNVGYGKGYSVKEVIETMKFISGVDFPVDILPRRDGDSAALISDNRKIKNKMKWIPKYEDLALICKSAYEWENSILKGCDK